MMLVRFTIVGAALAAIVCLAPRCFAQTDAESSRQSSTQPEDGPPSPIGEPDQTLEIAPRVPPPVKTAPASEPAAESPSGGDDAVPANQSDSAAASPGNAAAPGNVTVPNNNNAIANQKRPYLGASVQYIYSDDTPGRIVQGLEVVSLDPKSPAERAGLHGRSAMTKVGATGATAGVLAPPLDLVLMPLLRKAGSLGATGDLIVAIDDQPVQSDKDLGNALGALKPGDTIYFTIVRTMAGNSHKTLKIPVKLGDANEAVTEASGGDVSASPGANLPSQSR